MLMKRDTISREALLRRAEKLVDTLSARSEQCEAGRQCPAETIDDFVDSGLLRICQPARYGGYELSWDVLCEVSQILARGCGSQAWVQNVFSDHCQKVATFPIEAQDEVWAKTPDARVSASFDPVGRARPVDGGVMYSGRHGFSSGIDHAQWVICGGWLDQEDGKKQRSFFLLPTTDVTIIDDWHVMGFSGTGSKSFEAKDVFVPSYRILTGEDADAGTGPGTKLNTAPIFRLPRGGITSTGFAAIAVGIAEGFLKSFVEYTRPRKSRGVSLADLMGTQMNIGSASAEINAAGLIYIEVARLAMRCLEEGSKVPPELKLRAKRDSAYAAQLTLGAVSRLFNAAGGRALFLKSDLQRRYRDCSAAASHHSLVWDGSATEYGRHILEADTTP
jgi:3-hydroxy-9,10-secoandrosta-1,3,5(10)-triene-9,17-dione monooxygenase